MPSPLAAHAHHAASWYAKVRAYILAHKVLSAFVLIVVLFIGYRAYASFTSTASVPRYVLGAAQRETLIVSVTGTGQVTAQNQLELHPKASGEIVYVAAHDGDVVHQGQLIAEIDPTDAQKQVRDAQANLKSAELSLAKLEEPADAVSMTQAQNDVTSAENAILTAYSGSNTDLANTFLDLPSIMSGLNDIDFGSETNKNQQWNIDFYENAAAQYDSRASSYRDAAYNSYNAAKTSYDATFEDYKNVNIATADATTTERLLSETYKTLQFVNDALKSSNALIQFYSDQLTAHNLSVPTIASTQISSLSSYTSKVATHSSALLSDTTGIASDEGNLLEKQQSLQKLQAGADTIDLQSAQLSVQQKQNALQDAEDNLSDYYITAPFDGTVAVNVTPHQTVGTGDTAATIVTSEQLAQITLNEVDAATVKTGDKATLTFDAFPDLTIAGAVADISPVGTVSQGVVSYEVKIAFATQDPRIKSGMSVSAEIDTAVKQDALTVPGSAVHSNPDGSSYVLAFNPPLATSTAAAAGAQGVATTEVPVQIPVTTGLSNDTSTEITSGLSEGQQIVERAITSSSATQTSAPSIFGAAGGNRGTTGAGAGRALGR